jgi:hypothetical protein
MHDVAYDVGESIDSSELGEFYSRMQHETAATEEQLRRMWTTAPYSSRPASTIA